MILVLGILLAGAAVFSVLAIIAAERYRRVQPAPAPHLPPISVLKPLHGLDEGLRENLLSFFRQDYPAFEILFAVEDEDDAAVAVARQLIDEHPAIPARLLIAGPSPFPNAKVHSLRRMLAEARHQDLVMADSDVRVTRNFLQSIAAELSEPNVALVTCPYRAVAGDSFWSRLEAVGLNTEFIAGVLVARLLGGMDFALGPAIATRKAHLDEIGGLAGLQPYLAEDFVMGNRLAQQGHRVILSSHVIEHRIGAQALRPNFAHRLRWNRSTRRSRPLGYIGQIFTHPLPLALIWLACYPGLWPAAAIAIVVRYVAAWRTSRAVHARLAYIALPLQDVLSLVMWAAGFFGNEIIWRTRRFTIDRLGRFQPADGLKRTNELRR